MTGKETMSWVGSNMDGGECIVGTHTKYCSHFFLFSFLKQNMGKSVSIIFHHFSVGDR